MFHKFLRFEWNKRKKFEKIFWQEFVYVILGNFYKIIVRLTLCAILHCTQWNYTNLTFACFPVFVFLFIAILADTNQVKSMQILCFFLISGVYGPSEKSLFLGRKCYLFIRLLQTKREACFMLMWISKFHLRFFLLYSLLHLLWSTIKQQ